MVNQGGVEMRIAIIEDDEITRLELSKLLNTQGYETVLFSCILHSHSHTAG